MPCLPAAMLPIMVMDTSETVSKPSMKFFLSCLGHGISSQQKKTVRQKLFVVTLMQIYNEKASGTKREVQNVKEKNTRKFNVGVKSYT